jgi:hypothetical protein
MLGHSCRRGVVGVTGVPISSLVMPKLPETGSTEARAANRRLTVLQLPTLRPVRRVYHLVAVDQGDTPRWTASDGGRAPGCARESKPG